MFTLDKMKLTGTVLNMHGYFYDSKSIVMYTLHVYQLTHAHHFHLLVWYPKSVCAPKIGGWRTFNFKNTVFNISSPKYETKSHIF